MIVVAMIWILGATGVWYLDRQPLSLNTSIAQFDAMLNLARTHAATMSGGPKGAGNGTSVVAGVGATLFVQPDMNDSSYSEATLYWYRPIPQNPAKGDVEKDSTVAPLRIHCIIDATIPGYGSNRAFAIFISPSQHLSVISGGSPPNGWQPGSGEALNSEPICDPANAPAITFNTNGRTQPAQLVCSGAQMVLQSPGPSPS